MADDARAFVRTVCDQHLVGIHHYSHPAAPLVETSLQSGWKNHLVILVREEHAMKLTCVTYSLVKDDGSAERVSHPTVRVAHELEEMVHTEDVPAGYTCLVVRNLCNTIRWMSPTTPPKEPLVVHAELEFMDLPDRLNYECEATYYRTNVVKGTSLVLLRIMCGTGFCDAPESAWLSPGFSSADTLSRLIKWTRENAKLQATFLAREQAQAKLKATLQELKARGQRGRGGTWAAANAGAGYASMDAADLDQPLGYFFCSGEEGSADEASPEDTRLEEDENDAFSVYSAAYAHRAPCEDIALTAVPAPHVDAPAGVDDVANAATDVVFPSSFASSQIFEAAATFGAGSPVWEENSDWWWLDSDMQRDVDLNFDLALSPMHGATEQDETQSRAGAASPLQ